MRTTVVTGESHASARERLQLPFQDWERYHVLECLGEGGMGTVYKAFDRSLNRTVALKFLQSADPASEKRFLHEARAQSQIEHEHICKIYEVGNFAGRNYIAMQYLSGEPLDQVRSRLTIEQKARLIVQIADALQAAHRLGIVHRDIKPSNILVEQTDEGWRSCIVDFGLAREMSVPGATKTGVVMGTPSYMSPEQAWGTADEVDRRSDIYSLGATLYDLLTQNAPFQGTTLEVLVKLSKEDPPAPRKFVKHLPRDLETIVMKCLEKNPDRRYDSARALSEDLQHYLAGEPILARRAGRVYRFGKKFKKHRAVASIVAISFLLVATLGGKGLYVWWRSGKQLDQARRVAESVEGMEWQMRVEHTMSLHDIRKAKLQIRSKLKGIQERMLQAGESESPAADYALGRGLMTLDDFDAAKPHLEAAWKGGYQRPEVANALGVTFGVLYQTELRTVKGMEQGDAQLKRLKEIENNYRTPSLMYLSLGKGAEGSSPEYVLALIAFYQQDYGEALKQCSLVLDRSPWLYEAKILEGDIYSAQAEQVIDRDADKGIHLFLQSESAFRQASSIGASDPKVYVRWCELGAAVMHSSFYNKGANIRATWDKTAAICDEAIKVDPENSLAYQVSSRAEEEWAFYQGYIGEDPRPALQKAIVAASRAIELNPANSQLQFYLGQAYLYFMGDAWPRGIPLQQTAELAIQSFEKALPKDPGTEIYNELAYTYWYKALDEIDHGKNPAKSLNDSIGNYHKAVGIAPSAVTIYGNLINVLTTKAEYELNHGLDPQRSLREAIDVFQRCMKINAQSAFVIRNMAGAYVARGKFEMMNDIDPRLSFRQAIDLAEKADHANHAIASIFYSGMAHRYEAKYERQHKIDSRSSAEEAVAILERLASLKIEYAPFYSELAEARIEEAIALQSRNKPVGSTFQLAENSLDQAIAIKPNDSSAFVAKGKLYFLMAGRLNSPVLLRKAEEALQHAVQIKPDNGEAYCLLAMVNAQAVQFESKPQRRSTLLNNARSFLQKGIALNRFLSGEFRPLADRLNSVQ